MAFKDIEEIFYNGGVKITYHDKAHRYYVRERISPDLPVDNDLAWGKPLLTKGVTTLLDSQFDKSGLLGWAMGLCLRELFGFYDFKNEQGEHVFGFSKGVGTMWEMFEGNDPIVKDSLLPIVQSAAKAYQRKKKTGADIGSLVHDAAEQYTLGTPFELTLEKYKASQVFETPAEEEEWDAKASEELEMAKLAYTQFVSWWKTVQPKLIGAEQLVYSREFNFCGTFDALLDINGKRVLVDYKTSNASKSAGAPEGVYPSYLAQSALYALALEEMRATTSSTKYLKGVEITETNYDLASSIDDLLILSVRKDGQFSAVYASELGLTMEELKEWGKNLVRNFEMTAKTKKALEAHHKEREQ